LSEIQVLCKKKKVTLISKCKLNAKEITLQRTVKKL